MIHFSVYEKVRGYLSLLKAETIEPFTAQYNPPPDADVLGKTILITGATSGILPTAKVAINPLQALERKRLDGWRYVARISLLQLETKRRVRNVSRN